MTAVSLFIQIAGFLETLAPDVVWIGLLTPVFFSLLGLADVVGLPVPRATIRTIELSVLLAYVGSIAISHPRSSVAANVSKTAGSGGHA